MSVRACVRAGVRACACVCVCVPRVCARQALVGKFVREFVCTVVLVRLFMGVCLGLRLFGVVYIHSCVGVFIC